MGIQDRSYYRAEESNWRPPSTQTRSMVVILIIINVAIFLVDAFTPITESSDSRWLAHTLSLRGDLFTHPWNFWQLLTYGFAHASINKTIMHVVFNMVALFFLGRHVEQRYGSQEFLKYYLIAIVVSGLGWVLVTSLMSPNPSRNLCLGASGAVSAVVFLFVFNFPRERLLLMGVLPLPAWVLGVALVGMDILSSFNPQSDVAVATHLTGVLFAAAYYFGKWNFGWLKLEWLTQIFSRQPRLKIHNPGQRETRKRDQLAEQADLILKKVHTDGEASLTKAERKTLEKYSRMMRDDRTD